MKKYSAEEVYPKSQLGKCMVYFNMSHHYRRIYSAKPRVDTNLKKSSSSFCCSSPDVFNFVRRSCMKQSLVSTPRHRTCAKEEEEPKTYKPKILESRAESKLRSLPVYQPPQKVIKKTIQTEHSSVPVNTEDSKEDEKKGEDINLKSNKVSKNDKENSPKYEKRRESDFEKQIRERDKEERLRYRPLDKSTVMFLKDITDDILQKGIYTNKSLEKLFSHHISKNKYSLPKDLMEQEVKRLKLELEMPIEEEKFGSESSVEDDEVLSALDSLFLPADIRDQVASSLGLKLRPPPLPSPKDSFTGSLALTSMSENIVKEGEKSIGTFTMKSQPKQKHSIEIMNSEKTDIESVNKDPSTDKTPSANSKKVVSDDDKTTADEDYSEEVESEKKTNTSEEIHEDASSISEAQSEEIKHENASNEQIKEEEFIRDEENNSSEIRNGKTDSTKTKDDDVKDNGDSSDLSSIHTESDD